MGVDWVYRVMSEKGVWFSVYVVTQSGSGGMEA